jgi:hypothetical protein
VSASPSRGRTLRPSVSWITLPSLSRASIKVDLLRLSRH